MEADPSSEQKGKAGLRKGRKYGKPRGKGCHWTPELDELLKTSWVQRSPRAARRAVRQQQPTWSWSSIKKRAAALGLTRPKAPPWSAEDVNKLLMSIDSNASLALIAKRLNRSVAAIRYKLWELGYKAASLGGYKVKEVAEMLCVPPRRVQYWVQKKELLTKGGRITESSLSMFFRNCPEKIPYERLPSDMQAWLREMGYAAEDEEPKTMVAGKR